MPQPLRCRRTLARVLFSVLWLLASRFRDRILPVDISREQATFRGDRGRTGPDHSNGMGGSNHLRGDRAADGPFGKGGHQGDARFSEERQLPSLAEAGDWACDQTSEVDETPGDFINSAISLGRG